MYASRFDEASKVAKQVLEIDQSNVYALTVMALTYALDGNLDDTQKIYQRMADSDQYGESVAQEGLADLAMFRGNHANAVTLLDHAIETDKKRDSMHSVALKQAMRAEALLHLGRHDAALTATKEALEHSAGDPAVLVPVAVALIALNQADDAEAIAARLEHSVSRSDRAYAEFIRASMLEGYGNLQMAVEQAEAALEIADLWLVRAMLADLYLEVGQDVLSAREREYCRQRLGEAVAVFLNDRPTFRLVANANGTAIQRRADSARTSGDDSRYTSYR
jgi:tetratricopeptide (TPR) repeat protein